MVGVFEIEYSKLRAKPTLNKIDLICLQNISQVGLFKPLW